MLVDWTSHMLSNRFLKATKGNTTVRGNVSPGAPQGGVVSLLLWCLMANSLLEKLASVGFQEVDYADDILIIERGPFLHTMLARLQE